MNATKTRYAPEVRERVVIANLAAGNKVLRVDI